MRKWILALAATLAFTAQAAAADKVVLMLNWYVYGEHAPFYYGKAKGIYAAEGIDLEIQEGRGSAATTQAVAAKTAKDADAMSKAMAALKEADPAAANLPMMNFDLLIAKKDCAAAETAIDALQGQSRLLVLFNVTGPSEIGDQIVRGQVLAHPQLFGGSIDSR